MGLIVEGLHGFGDNLYQRAALKQSHRPLYLRTPWPQLYADMPLVRPLRSGSRLRTQAINESAADPLSWKRVADDEETITRRIFYGPGDLAKRSVPASISACLSVPEGRMDLPPLPPHGLDIPSPYAVVRPVTVRTEWNNVARNPAARHVADVAKELRAAGFFVVSLAHVSPPSECLVEPRPPADLHLLNGEVGTLRALSLVAGAAVVAGGVGWLVPAAFAAGVPLICVLGGQGGHNSPEKVTPLPHADHPALWLYPKRYCRCADMKHQCPKEIEDVAGQCKAWLRRNGLVRVGA